jgi:hypothetical protein
MGLDGEPEPVMSDSPKRNYGYELRIEPHSFLAYREH